MSAHPKCSECELPLSDETGWSYSGTDSDMRLHCPEHAPDMGKGYTLADMQQMREDVQAGRAQHEMAMMDMVGPDVYFAVKGHGGRPSPIKRLLKLNQSVYDKLREIGSHDDEESPRQPNG